MTPYCNVYDHILKVERTLSIWITPNRLLVMLSMECLKGPYLIPCYTISIRQTSASSYSHLVLNHHTHTDDNQIYSSCFPAECASLKTKITGDVDVVNKWIAFNWPMLNPSKSAFLWCSSSRWILLIDQLAYVLQYGSVVVSSIMQNISNVASYEQHSRILLKKQNNSTTSVTINITRTQI